MESCVRMKANPVPRAAFCLALLLSMVCLAACRRAAVTLPVQENISVRWQATGDQLVLIHGERLMAQQELARFYQQRNYEPGWSENGAPRPCVDSLIRELSQAEQEGLAGSCYHLSALMELNQPQRRSRNQEKWTADQLAELDILLSDAFLLFASLLQSGRVNPRTFDAEWFVRRDSADVVVLLEEAVRNGEVCQKLDDLRPRHPSYRRLCQALARFRTLAQQGAWPTVEYVAKLEPGARSPRIAQVRRRLRVTGEWTGRSAAPDSLFYDDALVEAVKSFQTTHGLEPDGIIGWSTVQEMNVTAEQRCTQIIVNLERWRWLYRDLGDRHIQVNIPTFELEVVEQDSIIMSMRVVVGKPARRTPVLSDIMTHLVLNPYWNVPVSIILHDMIPEIRRRPHYLSDRGIRLYPNWDIKRPPVDPGSVDWNKLNKNNLPYLFRQDPGPENALGRVKFVLHNDFDVYLHDSPTRGLFTRADRAFSSGCIRLQNPIDLAVYLLRDSPSWNREAILRTIQTQREATIALPRPYSVHLQYWTAWVNAQGELRFGRDIYQRDQKVANALALAPKVMLTERPSITAGAGEE